MSFDEEWGQARDGAATRMQLNQVDGAAGGTGAGDLRVASPDLRAVGHEASKLHPLLQSAGAHAHESTVAAASHLKDAGFATGAALAGLWETWSSQVSTLKDACAHIHNHLEVTVIAHKKHDDQIAAQMTVSAISKHFE